MRNPCSAGEVTLDLIRALLKEHQTACHSLRVKYRHSQEAKTIGTGAQAFQIAGFEGVVREWLEQFLDLSNGIPSHDRFNAVLGALKPAEFERCLLSGITALHEITNGQVVAIDGKTLRRSFDAASSKSAIHMVSAWATANHISLGQTVVDAKSNEITAIPKLLQMLELSGSLMTIDAMGCQTEIAQAIVDTGADYVLAVSCGG